MPEKPKLSYAKLKITKHILEREMKIISKHNLETIGLGYLLIMDSFAMHCNRASPCKCI